jgi:hypothetical protein
MIPTTQFKKLPFPTKFPKIKIYETVMLSTVLYWHETWYLAQERPHIEGV